MPARAPALAFLAALAACGGADDDVTLHYPLDGLLRLHHLQAKGTHNSYHVKPPHVAFPPWSYTHAPLDVQLGSQGVRHLELDLYFYDHPLLGEPPFFEVHHTAGDWETTCARLALCLGLVAAWSAAHPAHHPLVILLEPKDPFDAARATSFFDVLEAEVRSALPRGRILTPDDVRGDAATLREAVTERGWPTLGETRGKVMFTILESGAHRRAYEQRADRLFFVLAGMDEPNSAVVLVDDPVAHFDFIQRAVAQGFLVRTRADADGVEPRAGDLTRFERALASGAQLISTDYPAPADGVPYSIDIPGGTPSRCNPITAPESCTSRALEDPDFFD